jgi:hypothetical protein
MTTDPTTTPKPKRRWLRFSLRTLLVVFLVIGIGLALSVRAFHWSHRGIADIERIIVQGMAAVDAVERFANTHRFYPSTLEEVGITPPFTPSGYLNYGWYGHAGGAYHMYVYLGARDGHLRWDESNRCWVTEGRVPYELRWTEQEARELVKRAE